MCWLDQYDCRRANKASVDQRGVFGNWLGNLICEPSRIETIRWLLRSSRRRWIDSEERYRLPKSHQVTNPASTRAKPNIAVSVVMIHQDQCIGAGFLPAPPVSSCSRPPVYFFKCPETSLVISNMLTCSLPLKTAFRFSSALMRVFFFASCRPALRM